MPLWCDGDPSSFVSLSSDLSDLTNQLWIDSVYPYDGTTRILGSSFFAYCNSSAVKIVSPRTWQNPVVSFKAYGKNINVGYSASSGKIIINASYRYIDQNGIRKSRQGTGVTQYPYYEPSDIGGQGKLVVPNPLVSPQDPLAIQISMEDSQFIRDGVHSPIIVADVTWKGQYITDKFHYNDENLNPQTKDYPFPDVTFQAGTCHLPNYIPGTGSQNTPPTPRDGRGPIGACFEVFENPDVLLSEYVVTVSLSRTSIYSGNNSSHTHSCLIDSNGDGETNGTITIYGNIEDHVHTFSNYVSNSNLGHTHTPRSVAIVNLLPTTNPIVDITINAYVIYDPTGCDPYASSGNLIYPVTTLAGNRLMFNSLNINPIYVKDRVLELTVVAPAGNYTAEDVTDTNKGFNITAVAKFTAYDFQDYPGHWVRIPEQLVPDGTRIVFTINAYKPALTKEEAAAKDAMENGNVLVIRPDTVRKYMNIQVKGIVISDGLVGEGKDNTIVMSNLTWIPSIQGLLPEFTTDDIYINKAIDRIATIGASQIHDAVKFAAQRIIDYQTENTSWISAKKVIFLLTDGDENTSENSLSQAVSEVNIINGKCGVPIIPIRLGYSYSSDDVILGRYAQETCGQNYYMINSDATTEQDIIDDIITGGAIQINDGIFTNTIDLARDNLFATVSLESLSIPVGARVLFRYRLSSDAKNWSDWSEWYDSSISKDFELNLEFKARYFQYQIHLYGNENFESPELYAGITSYYYKVQTFSIFFQPIGLNINTDEYLASIHITHKGTIPSTSIINYGCAQFNTVNPEDYSQSTRPLITPDRHTIMLTRYNELFLPYNLLSYTAINGGWPDQAMFEVYRVNNSYPEGVLLDPSEFAANNKTGRITFYNIQRTEDKFVLCVYFDPEFRIMCNVVNYGPESIVIDHIGVLYNVTKRIPINSQGNIIHTPINERL